MHFEEHQLGARTGGLHGHGHQADVQRAKGHAEGLQDRTQNPETSSIGSHSLAAALSLHSLP